MFIPRGTAIENIQAHFIAELEASAPSASKCVGVHGCAALGDGWDVGRVLGESGPGAEGIKAGGSFTLEPDVCIEVAEEESVGVGCTGMDGFGNPGEGGGGAPTR